MSGTEVMQHGTFQFKSLPRFSPDRFMKSGHAQTVIPFFMRDEEIEYNATPHYVELPDGDQIVLHDDCPPEWTNGNRIVMLVHGLGGCHGSTYMVRIARRLVSRGYRVFRMDMRGCGAGLPLARGIFHAGRFDDLLHAAHYVNELAKQSPITVSGFSLGANLALKMLGEYPDETSGLIDSAVVVEPPIDLHYCCRKLGTGVGWTYDLFFARMLWRDFTQRTSLIPGASRLSIPRRPRTLLEFDSHITSQLAGFRDAVEYYDYSSSKNVLGRIRVPTAILTAIDDPIVPISMFENADWSTTTLFHVSEGGGHLGFIGTDAGNPREGKAHQRRWMDDCVVRWIDSMGHSPADTVEGRVGMSI
ncbi:MAG: alpha/beta fold hydrolase [Planctomycetota bacterium]